MWTGLYVCSCVIGVLIFDNRSNTESCLLRWLKVRRTKSLKSAQIKSLKWSTGLVLLYGTYSYTLYNQSFINHLFQSGKTAP